MSPTNFRYLGAVQGFTFDLGERTLRLERSAGADLPTVLIRNHATGDILGSFTKVAPHQWNGYPASLGQITQLPAAQPRYTDRFDYRHPGGDPHLITLPMNLIGIFSAIAHALAHLEEQTA